MDPAQAFELEVLSQQKVMMEATARGDSEVQRFYCNAVVFLTGGSGFLGKQLIEKLFRSCQIAKVYMLLRPKKGKNIQERLNETFKDPVFETLQRQKPSFSDRIIAVEGDVAELRLGIKDKDWRTLTEEVDVMFHVAATTRFDEHLRVATLINVRGTREALLLGKACKKLRSYVHISTAYSHAKTTTIGEEIEEEFYDSPVPPEAMISMAESVDPDRLTNITKELIKDWPNTYTFTKLIAEELVRTTSVGMPICIVRPAIVLCTSLEPTPGWLDISCIYGATGLLLASSLGVIHTVHTEFYNTLGIVPCDHVNNAIIVVARETATNQTKGGNDTKIYTVSSTRRNPVTWYQISKTINVKGRHLLSPKAIDYCYTVDTSSQLLFMALTLFLHLVPAFVADFVCLLIGKERRFVKTARKMYRMCNVMSYFLLNKWQLVDHNLEELFNSLSEQDKAIFNFDITTIDWSKYFLMLGVGIRKYIIKDGLKDTKYAVRKQRYLKVAHYIILALYILFLWKLFCLAISIISGLGLEVGSMLKF